MPPTPQDATAQIILQKPDGTQVWLGEWSAVHEALFLVQGLLDVIQGEEPDAPPPGRRRIFLQNDLLQVIDEAGVGGVQGELIATNSLGRRQVVPPGQPGSVLLRDSSNDLGVAWGNVLAVSDVPGAYQFGPRMSYQADASSIASQIQYTKVYLAKDTVISSMRVYRTTGGSGARFVRMGIYDQAVPQDDNGVPRTLLAQTASTATTGTNSYLTPPLTAPLTIPVTGFYWLAFITDTATPLRFQTSFGIYPPAFLPIYLAAGAGTTLPATAAGLTQPASAVIFVGALE